MVRIIAKADETQEADAIQYKDTSEGIADVMRFLDRKAIRLYVEAGGTTIGFDQESLAPGQWLIKDHDGKFWVWHNEFFVGHFKILPE